MRGPTPRVRRRRGTATPARARLRAWGARVADRRFRLRRLRRRHRHHNCRRGGLPPGGCARARASPALARTAPDECRHNRSGHRLGGSGETASETHAAASGTRRRPRRGSQAPLPPAQFGARRRRSGPSSRSHMRAGTSPRCGERSAAQLAVLARRAYAASGTARALARAQASLARMVRSV
jgi:hypothetical protein